MALHFRRLHFPLTLLLAVVLLAFVQPGAVLAQNMTIAAVVNDQLITQFDLDQRIQLAINSAGLRDTPDTRNRLRGQVLRTLIDEKLEDIEGKRLGISVSSVEVENAKRIVEQRNNMPRGAFSRFLTEQNIPEAAVLQQMTIEILWSKLVRQILVPQVNITEQEIDAELARIQASTGKFRYLVSEIFLPSEQGQRDADLRAQTQRIADDIRNGANFGNVARQFSRGPSAFDAGDIGWIMEDQLSPELGNVLKTMEVGTISAPISAAGGYYLLHLRDRRMLGTADPREARIHLKQILLPLPVTAPAAEVQRAEQRANAISAGVKGCEAMDTMIKEVGNPQSGDLGTVKIGDLPARFAGPLADLEVGRASQPIRSDTAIHVFMVCERAGTVSQKPSRDEVATTLGQQRLDLLERRYLRDMRRNATVDIRVR